MSKAYEIAAKVLALAAVMDPRIPDYDPFRVNAWADCFEGKDLWEREALQAVRDHYSKPNPFPLYPGDVIAAVAAMPVTSSPDRVSAYLDKWSQYPYSGEVQRLTGLEWEPTFPVPEYIIGAHAERDWHREELMTIVHERRSELVNNTYRLEQKALTTS